MSLGIHPDPQCVPEMHRGGHYRSQSRFIGLDPGEAFLVRRRGSMGAGVAERDKVPFVLEHGEKALILVEDESVDVRKGRRRTVRALPKGALGELAGEHPPDAE